MFATLEERQVEFGVESFGISLNSLEQVFIKVDEMASINPNTAGQNERLLWTSATQLAKQGQIYSVGAKLAFAQIGALLWRSALYAWRHKFRTIAPFIGSILLFLPFAFGVYDFSSKLCAPNLGDFPIHIQNIPTSKVPIITTTNETNFMANFKRYANDKLPQLSLWNVNGTSDSVDKQIDANYLRPPPYSIGFETGKSKSDPETLLFSSRLVSGASFALNAMSNVLLHAANKSFGEGAMIRAGFRKSSAYADYEEIKDLLSNNGVEIDIIIVTLIYFFVLSWILSTFVLDLVAERTNNFQHQIFLTKVTVLQYWLGQFLANFIYFATVCLLLNVLCAILANRLSIICIASMIPLFFLFFLAATSMTYVLSLNFQSKTKAFTITFFWHTILSMSFLLTLKIISTTLFNVFDIEKETTEKLDAVVKILSDIFTPSLAFTNSFSISLLQCQQRVAQKEFNFFALYGPPTSIEEMKQRKYIGGSADHVAMLVATTLIWLTVLTLMQWRQFLQQFHRWSHRKYRKLCHPPLDEDPDVTAEREVVARQSNSHYALAVRDLYKFHNKSICAVRDLTFGVQPDECFGLLGVNGAGKTSTLDILTAVAYPTAGTASIYGISVDERPALGYCPQFDALVGSLTGRETLTLIGRLNGLVDVDWRVNKVLECIRLEREADKIIRNYSGGQKRRISIGVALMSCARLIMLDEPTAGVDPSTRRHVWDLLSALRRNGTALLLTTHSMEECEALCTKVGFMSRGAMISIGTNQNLKSKFGNSFLLTVTPRQPSAAFGRWLNRRVVEAFEAPAIHDDALAAPTLAWQLPRRGCRDDRWSALYRRVDALMADCERVGGDEPADYAIRDYSLVQSSMEQVFVHLTNM